MGLTLCVPAAAEGPAATPCETRASALDSTTASWTASEGLTRTASIGIPDVGTSLGVTWTTRVRVRTGDQVVEWTTAGPVSQPSETMGVTVDMSTPAHFGPRPAGTSIVNVFLLAEDIESGIAVAELSLPPSYIERTPQGTDRITPRPSSLPMISGLIDNDRGEMELVRSQPTVVHPNYSDDDSEVNP